MVNKSVKTAPVIVFLVMGVFYHMGESLASPIRITGRVLEDREPVAGARVELHPAAPAYEEAIQTLAGGAPVPLASTRTAADGTFALLVPDRSPYRVIVQAPGRLVLEHLVLPVKDKIPLPPAELRSPATITIQALGPDGRPLAGLPLRVAPSTDDDPWRPSGWHPAERQGVTGPDGKLTLPRWKLEPLSVYVTDPLYLGQVASEVRDDAVTVRPESRPRTVEVLGAQGEPVAGALFRWGTWPVGVTGPDGRLSVSLPEDEKLPLLVEGPGGERAEMAPGVEPVAGILVVRLVAPEAEPGRIAGLNYEACERSEACFPAWFCRSCLPRPLPPRRNRSGSPDGSSSIASLSPAPASSSTPRLRSTPTVSGSSPAILRSR